jgi:hypothetical protein
MYCLILLLSIYPLSGYRRMLTYDEKLFGVVMEDLNQELTPMEALDLVQRSYAANFEKVEGTLEEENYYYKLPQADYYLFFEGRGESEQQYLFHLYEFVFDEPEEGIGHTVTYGWFMVDKMTGEIIEVQ